MPDPVRHQNLGLMWTIPEDKAGREGEPTLPHTKLPLLSLELLRVFRTIPRNCTMQSITTEHGAA